MAQGESRANATWQGNLREGHGSVSATSGVLQDAKMTWHARANRTVTTPATSPEELIAASLASCFAMAFSNALAGNGTPPNEIDVTATAHFDTNKGARIRAIHLDVQGKVPNISADQFEKFAGEAKDGCPVSQALKGNVDISMDAQLANQG